MMVVPFVVTLFSHFLAMFYVVPFVFEYTNGTNVKETPDYITNSIPFFILLALLEYSYGKWRKFPLYTMKDTIMSLSLGTVQQLIGIWLKEIAYVPYIFAYHYFAPHRAALFQSIFGTPLKCVDDPIATESACSASDYYNTQMLYFIVGFLGCDISYYFMHRSAHEWHLFWSSHSVHHSGERYNLITALRQGSFQGAYSWLFYLPWAVVGLPPVHYLRHNRLNTIYQFWIHTEMIGRLPWWFELIMNTPSHHRPHHRPPGNCNYGGVLILWDRLFGTFIAESSLGQENSINTEKDVKTDFKRGIIYGLSKPLVSYDPVKANIQHLINLSNSRVKSLHPSIWERLLSLLNLVWRKRVHHPYIISTDATHLIPDILFDWKYEATYRQEHPNSNILSFYWKRMWTLPPEVPAVEDIRSKVADTSVWTVRDLTFVEGREERNSPKLTTFHGAIVIAHFVVVLGVSYALLLIHSLPLFSEGNTGKIYTSLYITTCLLLLQTIQFHYFQPKQKFNSPVKEEGNEKKKQK